MVEERIPISLYLGASNLTSWLPARVEVLHCVYARVNIQGASFHDDSVMQRDQSDPEGEWVTRDVAAIVEISV